MPSEEELIRGRLESLPHEELVARLLSLAGRDVALRLALVTEAQAAGGELDLRTLARS